MEHEDLREKAIAAFKQRDAQREQGQKNQRVAYRNTLTEEIVKVFHVDPELPEEIEVGRPQDVFGLTLALNTESKLVALLHCEKCGGTHGATLIHMADAGKIFCDPSVLERACKGKPKDFETDLLKVLTEIRDEIRHVRS